MFRTAVVAIAAWIALSSAASGSANSVGKRIDSYVAPYVASGNFSGVVLVKKGRRIVFQEAYGFADREGRIRNTRSTRFHIASVSMQYTATAVLRLIDQGNVTLNTHVGSLVPGIAGAEKISVKDLLSQRSGLPDINQRADYNQILQQHQTPVSLVAKIERRPLLFEPGSKYMHEEHSAYNLLALIVESKTGLPFAAAVDHLVFRPVGLRQSGIDDDSLAQAPNMAVGLEPIGTTGLKPAREVHWSAKTGNASVYATASDEAKFVDALFASQWLGASSRAALHDTSERVGYGWFRGTNKRFNETAYYMNGRAPGFSSFVLYLPSEKITVVVFSNISSSATTTIGYDIAAIALGLPHTPFRANVAMKASELSSSTGKFKFGADFYQADAVVELAARGPELSLRWPSGDLSPLIPMGHDSFIDRAYWEEVKIERDEIGRPGFLDYGQFRGKATTP